MDSATAATYSSRGSRAGNNDEPSRNSRDNACWFTRYSRRQPLLHPLRQPRRRAPPPPRFRLPPQVFQQCGPPFCSRFSRLRFFSSARLRIGLIVICLLVINLFGLSFLPLVADTFWSRSAFVRILLPIALLALTLTLTVVLGAFFMFFFFVVLALLIVGACTPRSKFFGAPSNSLLYQRANLMLDSAWMQTPAAPSACGANPGGAR